jgi:succinyl-diaminopimelate desuccinylase
MTDRAADLAADTLSLVQITSESRNEAGIVDAVRSRLTAVPGLRLADDHDTVLAALPGDRRRDTPLILLAGHLDTVPAAGTDRGSLDDGVVHGRGAADMKGGLAVMLALAEEGVRGSRVDVGYLFFGREEVPITESAVLPAFDRVPELREAALAVILEPTANTLEVGCNGNLQATVRVHGRAAHSARPWHGDNAIHAAIEALAPVTNVPGRDVDIDGLVFREVVSVTTIAGGTASNVVPNAVEATVNVRYAPSRTPDEAVAWLRGLLADPRAEVEIVSNAPPGPVCLSNAMVKRLRDAGDLEVRPKQGWTPVAEFAMGGVDAVNLGPGDPRYAHSDDEQVGAAALLRTYDIVSAFLAEEA